jgi:hypothetical protein
MLQEYQGPESQRKAEEELKIREKEGERER